MAIPEANRTAPLWIKVCGLVDVGNAVAVARTGVDAIGLNFYAKSKRVVTVAAATAIVEAVVGAVASDCEPVGLFVNATPQEVADVCGRTGIRTVQLHGDESDDDLDAIGAMAEVDSVIRALRLRQIDELAWDDTRPQVNRLLLDALSTAGFGGTGQQLDWSTLPSARSRVAGQSVVLAGGLTPTNVAEAVRVARPDGVDTASGVEERPGWKDIDQVRAFVLTAREAHQSLAADGAST